ncbi:MAG: hypothetical protein KY468_03840 [Armatimonadetes bacterium]|nr:hypothetical protein [Armatimonadota bacterium]
MKWMAGAMALLMTLTIAGCGLGNRRFQPPEGASAQEAVILRDRFLNNSLVEEEIGNALNVYSDLYRNPSGQTKADLRQGFLHRLQNEDLIRIDVLSDVFEELNADETLLRHTVVKQIISRNKTTGQQSTETRAEVQEWVREGNIWRILSSFPVPVPEPEE